MTIIAIVSEGEALARLRALKPYGVTCQDLGERFGVSAAFVSSVLLGKKRPNAVMLEAVGLRRAEVFMETED